MIEAKSLPYMIIPVNFNLEVGSVLNAGPFANICCHRRKRILIRFEQYKELFDNAFQIA